MSMENSLTQFMYNKETAEKNMLSQLIQQKETLKDISKIMSAGHDLGKLLDHFIDAVQELLKITRIAVLFEESGGFKIKTSQGISSDIIQQVFLPINEGLIRYLMEEGTALRIEHIRSANLLILNQFRSLGVTTAVPVYGRDRLKAVIVFNNKVIGIPITDDELELVFALGSQLAVAIENAGLLELISRQKNYFENVLTNVSSAVISVDTSRTIVTYNPKAEEILGINISEVIGRSIDSLPHDLGLLINETINAGIPVFRKELKLTELDKIVGASSTPIRDNCGKIKGAVIIFTDLAPIKELEEKARRSDRLDFVNTVAMRSSHELKNCLVAIKTFAQLLPERYTDRQFREDFFQVVNKEVDRLNQVVENLLFFAQPLKLDCISCDIEDLLQETLENIAKEGLLEGIDIKKEYNHISPVINIDRDAVKKVFKHMFYNSIQAMPKGGGIRIVIKDVTENDRSFLEIKIIDEGVGIPEDVIDKVWEPFFTTKTRGIGLGMTIVRKIVEEHGGRSTIKSRLYNGTEVTVIFPQIPQKKGGEKLYFPSGRAVII